jgi:hypothetical protein
MGRYFYMEYTISDYNYIASAIGNAKFSGLTLEQIWSCIAMCKTREQLDAAISAAIRLKEISGG